MHIKNKLTFNPSLLPLVAAVLAVSACSYFDAPDPTAEQINLMAPEAVAVIEEPAAAPRTLVDYNQIAETVSSREVKVFGMDDAAPAAVSGALTPISSGGQMSAEHPNVEVFPLEGGAPVAPVMHSSAAHAPAAAPVAPVDVVVPGTDGTTRIYFTHDSAGLNAQDDAILSRVSSSIANQPVAVRGYASSESSIKDPVKRKIVNLRTSLERAYAVSRSLINKGVPAEQIETTAYGENTPAAPTGELSTDAAARRVEISPK